MPPSLLRSGENFLNDCGNAAAKLVFFSKDKPVGENFWARYLILARWKRVFAIDGGERLRRAEQPQGGARARPEEQGRVFTRGPDDFQYEIIRLRRHSDFAHGLLTFQNAIGRSDRLKRFDGMTQLKTFDHFFFIRQVWIPRLIRMRNLSF